MSIESLASNFGIDDKQKFVKRVVWTTSTFIIANGIASIFFNDQLFKKRVIFSLLQSASFIFLIENRIIEDGVSHIKSADDREGIRKVIDYALFFFLGLGPIMVSRALMRGIFQPVSYVQSFQIGFFNYFAGLGGLALYDKIAQERTRTSTPFSTRT